MLTNRCTLYEASFDGLCNFLGLGQHGYRNLLNITTRNHILFTLRTSVFGKGNFKLSGLVHLVFFTIDTIVTHDVCCIIQAFRSLVLGNNLDWQVYNVIRFTTRGLLSVERCVVHAQFAVG